MKKAIITGIAGQDGAFLADLLVKKGYQVIGADRRRVDSYYWRLESLGITSNIQFEYFDLLEESNIVRLIKEHKPDEFYNLAAQSFVQYSFDNPFYTKTTRRLGLLFLNRSVTTTSSCCRSCAAPTK